MTLRRSYQRARCDTRAETMTGNGPSARVADADGVSLDLLAPDLGAEPPPTFARLREEDPVHWSEHHRAWVITRYDDVTAAFRDLRLSSDRASPMAREPARDGGGEADPVVSFLSHWMVFRAPPVHTRL